MKLARIDLDGRPEFAASRGDDRWYPLAAHGIEVHDTPALIDAFPRIADLDLEDGPMIGEPRLLAPVVRPGKMLGIGLNYLDHIRESGKSPLEKPFVFAKFPSSATGPYDDVVVDRSLTLECDWEVELAVVIGRPARDVDRGAALEHVFGYLVANDVSARDLQELPGQFSRSKSFDTFCPLGPWITTADEVADPQRLDLRCTVDGHIRQDSSTAEMLFSVAELIEFLSRGTTLEPGDVILSGTPHGVGLGMEPPTYLEDGQLVRCTIEGLGEIANRVVFRPGAG
jgi:2-keto-4-pentenoate hydratase/2-oxohepta-3-ene-1,7-dioic acid hydratase in catechol pathway